MAKENRGAGGPLLEAGHFFHDHLVLLSHCLKFSDSNVFFFFFRTSSPPVNYTGPHWGWRLRPHTYIYGYIYMHNMYRVNFFFFLLKMCFLLLPKDSIPLWVPVPSCSFQPARPPEARLENWGEERGGWKSGRGGVKPQLPMCTEQQDFLVPLKKIQSPDVPPLLGQRMADARVEVTGKG